MHVKLWWRISLPLILVLLGNGCAEKGLDVKTVLTKDVVFVDQSRILTPEQESELSALLEAHNQKGPGRLSLLIVDQISPTGPKDIQSFVDAKVNGKADRIIFVLIMKNRRLKLSWSDEISALLKEDARKEIMDQIVPKFREGNYHGGFKEGFTLLIEMLEKPKAEGGSVK